MKTFNQYIIESDTSKATAFEDAIVMGYYKAQKRKIPSDDKLGIKTKNYNFMINNKEFLSLGTEIAKTIMSKVGKGNAMGFGSKSASISKFWKSHGGSNPTPKTDIILNKNKISLKVGPAQLMSGGKEEAMATFYAAVDSLGRTIDRRNPVFAEVVDLFDGFTRGLTSQGTVADFQRFDTRPGHAGEKNPSKKAGKDKNINRADKVHKKMTLKLIELFEKNEDFHIQFLKEAISGKYKFGAGNLGFARFILVADKTGHRLQWHSSTDEKYIKKLIPRTNIKVRFKSSSQKKTVKGVESKTGNYQYWSIIGITTKAMLKAKNKANEEIESMRNGSLLTEQEMLIAEENIFMRAWNAVKKFLTELFKKVIDWIRKSVNNMIEFLGLSADVTLNGLDSNINFS